MGDPAREIVATVAKALALQDMASARRRGVDRDEPLRWTLFEDDARTAVVATLEAIEQEMPDDLDLFRTIRAAGRKDSDKAKAVLAMMPNFAAAIKAVGEGALQNEPGTS